MFTVTETAAEVLERKLALPAYRAVRLYVSAASEVVVSVATPEESSVAVPSSADPFMKLTVPEGAMLPMPWTVAVRVRVWPVATGLGDAVRVVVVAAA